MWTVRINFKQCTMSRTKSSKDSISDDHATFLFWSEYKHAGESNCFLTTFTKMFFFLPGVFLNTALVVIHSWCLTLFGKMYGRKRNRWKRMLCSYMIFFLNYPQSIKMKNILMSQYHRNSFIKRQCSCSIVKFC